MSYHINTRCVNTNHKDALKASIPPLYLSSTFKAQSLDDPGEYDYTRSGNPTRTSLQNHLERIIGCKHVLAVNSGMSCLDIVVQQIAPGSELIAGEDLYGGSHRLLQFIKNKRNVDVKHYDTTNTALMLSKITAKTKMVLLESPTNPLINIVDVKTIADHAHKVNPDCLVVFDNTMMTPLLMSPLELGVDIQYESATKFLNGHHDIMAGILATNSEKIFKDLYFVINSIGSGLAPFDSWLLIRGLKTLSIRVERQQKNAQMIAEFLEAKGLKVRYPGLKGYKNAELHFKQCRGAGAVLSFETGDLPFSEAIVNNTKLLSTTVSFGAVNSLISLPCKMSHASIDKKTREEREFPEDLVRICVGIEEGEDLLADLEQAIRKAKGGKL
ncbi:cystathionine beta-lyase [Martiniozyma asiatica (nom. inval.)]|nr:cystathionine beta-lyase [Martiniozyma asiatica]